MSRRFEVYFWKNAARPDDDAALELILQPYKFGGAIYCIIHLESRRMYVGSTVCLGSRMTYHYGLLVRDKHVNRKLRAAWKRFGASAFEFRVLQKVSERTALIEAEQKWMDKLDAYRTGYNILPEAGTWRRLFLEPEHKARIAATAKARYASMTRDERVALMRHLFPLALIASKNRTPEQRKAISERMRGNRLGVGIRPRWAKLSDEEVLALITMIAEGATWRAAAAAFGLKSSAVSQILAGKNYKKVRIPAALRAQCRQYSGRKAIGSRARTAKLNEQDIPVIRARLRAGEKARIVAADYGVFVNTVRAIKYGHSWRHVA